MTKPARDGVTIRVYDFRSPARLGAERSRRLRHLFGRWAGLVATRLCRLMRAEVRAALTELCDATPNRFAERFAEPAVAAFATDASSSSMLVLELPSTTALQMADLLMAGPGSAGRQSETITDLEAAVLEPVFSEIVEAMNSLFPRTGTRVELLSVERNPVLARAMMREEPGVQAAFELSCNRSRGGLGAFLSWTWVDRLLEQGPEGGHAPWRGNPALDGRAASSGVPIWVELRSIEMPLGACPRIQEGSRLPMGFGAESAQEAILMVAGKPKFSGTSRSGGRHLVMKIIESAESGDGFGERDGTAGRPAPGGRVAASRIPVRVSIRSGTVTIGLSDLAAMAPGDVLMLPVDPNGLEIWVGDLPYAWGKPDWTNEGRAEVHVTDVFGR